MMHIYNWIEDNVRAWPAMWYNLNNGYQQTPGQMQQYRMLLGYFQYIISLNTRVGDRYLAQIRLLLGADFHRYMIARGAEESAARQAEAAERTNMQNYDNWFQSQSTESWRAISVRLAAGRPIPTANRGQYNMLRNNIAQINLCNIRGGANQLTAVTYLNRIQQRIGSDLFSAIQGELANESSSSSEG
jgi:hypothetical protein